MDIPPNRPDLARILFDLVYDDTVTHNGSYYRWGWSRAALGSLIKSGFVAVEAAGPNETDYRYALTKEGWAEFKRVAGVEDQSEALRNLETSLRLEQSKSAARTGEAKGLWSRLESAEQQIDKLATGYAAERAKVAQVAQLEAQNRALIERCERLSKGNASDSRELKIAWHKLDVQKQALQQAERAFGDEQSWRIETERQLKAAVGRLDSQNATLLALMKAAGKSEPAAQTESYLAAVQSAWDIVDDYDRQVAVLREDAGRHARTKESYKAALRTAEGEIERVNKVSERLRSSMLFAWRQLDEAGTKVEQLTHDLSEERRSHTGTTIAMDQMMDAADEQEKTLRVQLKREIRSRDQLREVLTQLEERRQQDDLRHMSVVAANEALRRALRESRELVYPVLERIDEALEVRE